MKLKQKLVISQKAAQMVDHQATRQNFERLNSYKKCLENPFGPWPIQPEFWQTIIETTHNCIQKYTNLKRKEHESRNNNHKIRWTYLPLVAAVYL